MLSVDNKQKAHAVPEKTKLYAAVDFFMNFGRRKYEYVHGSHFIYRLILPKMRGSIHFRPN